MSIQINFEGNLGKQAEIKTTKTGKTFTNLTVASTPRKKINGEWSDGETIWFNVTYWGELPEVVYAVGARVLVSGSLETKTYEKDGVEKKILAVNAESIGIAHRQAKVAAPTSTWNAPTTESEMPF